MAKSKMILSYVSTEAEEKLAFKNYVDVQRTGKYNMYTEAYMYGPDWVKKSNLNARLIRQSCLKGQDIEAMAFDWIFEIISNYERLSAKYSK